MDDDIHIVGAELDRHKSDACTFRDGKVEKPMCRSSDDL